MEIQSKNLACPNKLDAVDERVKKLEHYHVWTTINISLVAIVLFAHVSGLSQLIRSWFE